MSNNIPYISISDSDSLPTDQEHREYYPPSSSPNRLSRIFNSLNYNPSQPSEKNRKCTNRITPIIICVILTFVIFVIWQIDLHPDSVVKVKAEEMKTNFSGAWCATSPKLNYDGGCNPFDEPGYINYDSKHYLNNTWKTFRPDCMPENLMKQLVEDLQRYSRGGDHKSPRALPWLQNRTIVLIGDSIDRFHLRDFCDLLSASIEPPFHPVSDVGRSPSPSTPDSPSQSFHVDPNSKLTTPPYFFNPQDHSKTPDDWPSDKRSQFAQQQEEWAKRDNIRTKPWVCEVPIYGFRIVSLFTYGLEPYQSGYFFSNEDWYLPPSGFLHRVDHILLPLLQNLAKERNAPQILRPDLLEVGSGLWDLRQWTEADSRAIGHPIDDSSEVPYETLTQDRLGWWKERAVKVLEGIATRFPDSSPILWRTLHHPLRHTLAPYSRVEQLDQLARYVVAELQRRPGPLSTRLQIDNWGRMMLGQENHFRDILHPRAAPGNVLWGEMILWELRRTVMMKENVKAKSRPQIIH